MYKIFSLLLIPVCIQLSCIDRNNVEKESDPESGIKIVKDSKNHITSVEVYKNHNKNGICSYYKNDTLTKQLYFIDNKPTLELSPPVVLKLVVDTVDNYQMLTPKNWVTKIKSKEHPELILYCYNDIIYQEMGPNFNILKINHNNLGIDSIMTLNILGLKSESRIQNIQKEKDEIEYTAKVNNITLVCKSKIIVFNNYYLIITCATNDKFYNDSYPILNTIINSFQKL